MLANWFSTIPPSISGLRLPRRNGILLLLWMITAVLFFMPNLLNVNLPGFTFKPFNRRYCVLGLLILITQTVIQSFVTLNIETNFITTLPNSLMMLIPNEGRFLKTAALSLSLHYLLRQKVKLNAPTAGCKIVSSAAVSARMSKISIMDNVF